MITMGGSFSHIPVLASEVVDNLVVKDGPCRIIDGTVGYGGHSSLILRKNRRAVVLGIDRDGEALSHVRESLAFASDRVHLYRGEFSGLADFADEQGWSLIDGILLDLGVSSPQIDDPRRGFSHRLDGPLDMRMDKRSPITASRILNRYPEDDLKVIFREYGEIRRAGKLAAAIVARRMERPWEGTLELAELCERVLGRTRPGGPPAPTLCFQALRMAVNSELDNLAAALAAGLELLAPGGRFAVISFHSLEDRMVKRFFRREASECLCPPGLPQCVCGHKPRLRLVTRKVITAGENELKVNRRAASARLRVAERI